MSGRFRKGNVVVVSPLKRFGDHSRPRDKIRKKLIFCLQNKPYQGLTAVSIRKNRRKSIFCDFCREDESDRQTFLEAKQQPQCPSETALTSR